MFERIFDDGTEWGYILGVAHLEDSQLMLDLGDDKPLFPAHHWLNNIGVLPKELQEEFGAQYGLALEVHPLQPGVDPAEIIRTGIVLPNRERPTD